MNKKLYKSLTLIVTMYSCYAYGTFSKPHIYVEHSLKRWTKGIQKHADRQLAQVAKIPLLAQHLPAQWSIIFTENIPGGGFHRPMTKDPHGRPTLFMSPSEMVLNGDAGNMAHEVFHLVHGLSRPQEEEWLQEGLALAVEAQVSRRFIGAVKAAFDRPEVSLAWPLRWDENSIEQTLVRTSQYAHLQLMMTYAFRFCGGWQLLEALTFAPSHWGTGAVLFDRVLSDLKLKTQSAWPAYCESIAALHARVQTLKYWPRFDLDDGFLIQDPTLSARVAPAQPQKETPRFSAVAFAKNSEGCPRGSQELGPSLCLLVRDP
ncbi:MAG: hypothetical protein AB7N80_11650 [Bdellovibrionales bacterium]